MTTDNRRDHVIYYQYRADRARRTPARDRRAGRQGRERRRREGPGEAEPVHQAHRRDEVVNRDLEAKARALAGMKGYVTNLANPTPEFVIGAYHQLWQIEKSFRMSKHDLRARPIYHHKRESIEAHLTIVFAALAVTRLIEARTGWTIKQFVRTARRYRTIQIHAGDQTITADDPLPDRPTRRPRPDQLSAWRTKLT